MSEKYQHTDAGKQLTKLTLEIFRTNGLFLDIGNILTARHGLTSARWQVMGAIDYAENPLSVAQIARLMGLTRQSVQRTVNDLEDLGMVELRDNASHKRARLVHLTREGELAQEKVNQSQVLWSNEAAADINSALLADFVATLKQVRKKTEAFRVRFVKAQKLAAATANKSI